MGRHVGLQTSLVGISLAATDAAENLRTSRGLGCLCRSKNDELFPMNGFMLRQRVAVYKPLSASRASVVDLFIWGYILLNWANVDIPAWPFSWFHLHIVFGHL